MAREDVNGYEIVKTYHGNLRLTRTGDQKGMQVLFSHVKPLEGKLKLETPSPDSEAEIVLEDPSPLLKVRYAPNNPPTPDSGFTMWVEIPQNVKEKIVEVAKEEGRLR